jgi:tetratricopeptide (TPR) repeat protein
VQRTSQKHKSRALSQALSEAQTLVAEGHAAAAEKVLRMIIAAEPTHAESLHRLGLVLRDQQRLDEALAALVAAARCNQHDPAVLNDLGMLLTAMGRSSEALTVYNAALTVAGNEPAILSNRGNALAQLGRLQDALADQERALAREPKYFNALYNRSNMLLKLRRFSEAIAGYDRVLEINPDFGPAFNNRGNAKLASSCEREALVDYERAAALLPDNEEVGCNVGIGRYNLNRDKDALAAYTQVLSRNPASAIAHYQSALSLLRLGDFQSGWQEYEWRWGCPFFQPMLRKLPAPLWRGRDDLTGKRILLHGEQGFGDMMQFVRYVPLVKARGATVILEIPPELASLLRSVVGVDEFVVHGEHLPGFDFHCPLLTLPLSLQTDVATIPAAVPYLSVLPDRCAHWLERIGSLKGPRIGLVWSGRATHARDHSRSLAFTTLAPLLTASGGSFVSLQVETRDADRAALDAQSQILSLDGELRDFGDTAAVIAHLDLIIAVDTSVAHLAGALGKPVWILLPWSPDFRWLHQREDSPWYPSARLFRQPKIGDWTSVINRVATELSALG